MSKEIDLLLGSFVKRHINHFNKIELAELNKLVLDYAIPQVLGEVESYVKYKHDVSTLAVPLQSPAYISTAGSNTLELKPFF